MVRPVTSVRLRRAGTDMAGLMSRSAPSSTGVLSAIRICAPVLLVVVGITTSAVAACIGGLSAVSAAPAAKPSAAATPTVTSPRRRICRDLVRSSGSLVIWSPYDPPGFPLPADWLHTG